MEVNELSKIERLIETGKLEEARQALDESLRKDMRDPAIWALSAYAAGSKLEQDVALRNVFEQTENVDLSSWALKELAAVTARETFERVTRPPLALLEVAKLNPAQRKPVLSLRLVRFGLLAFFFGLIAVGVLFNLQERGFEQFESGARHLLPILRLSFLCILGSAAIGVIGVLLALAGVVISIFPRRG